MSVLEEGAFDEEGGEEGSPEPKSKTALSILESLASAERTTAAAPADDSGVDAESDSVESADSVEGGPVEDVFELEGLDGVSNWYTLKSREKLQDADKARKTEGATC